MQVKILRNLEKNVIKEANGVHYLRLTLYFCEIPGQVCAKIPYWMKAANGKNMNRIFHGDTAPENIPWLVSLRIPTSQGMGFYISPKLIDFII